MMKLMKIYLTLFFIFLGQWKSYPPTYLQEGKSVKGKKKPNFQVFSFLALLDWLQLGSN